jgi:hypothetical protein
VTHAAWVTRWLQAGPAVPQGTACIEAEQSLSHLLSTRVIGYSVSDTSGYIGCRLYENGGLLEELSVLEGGSDLHQDKFFSSLRDLERDDIANVWSFTREFLVDQDAFDPGSTSRTSLAIGATTYRPVTAIASSIQALRS